MEKDDIIRISAEARKRMQDMAQNGQSFHIVMENHS